MSDAIQFRPVVAPVIGAKLAPIYPRDLLDRDALVGGDAAAPAPVRHGLHRLAELLRKCGDAAGNADSSFDRGLRLHAPTLHEMCTHRQQLVFAESHTPCMSGKSAVWHRIDEELQRRRDRRLRPSTWA